MAAFPRPSPDPASAPPGGVGGRALAEEALRRVDEEGARVADALRDAAAEVGGVPDREGDLAAEIATGVLRTEGALDAVLAVHLRRPFERVEPDVVRVLRIGAYQLLHLDRVPARAVVHTSVELVRDVGRPGAAGLVNAVLRRVADAASQVVEVSPSDPRRSLPRTDGRYVALAAPVFPDPARDLAGNLAARYAVPRGAVERWLAQHGKPAVRRILAASIARPPIALRPALGRADGVRAALTAAGIAFDEEGPCLLVRGVGDVRRLPGWDVGDFAVQDPTAAEAAEFVEARAGEWILDVCAAPGGKTVALAERVGPAGRVVATDVPGPRLERLRAEVDRRRLVQVEVVAADAAVAAALPVRAAGAAQVAAPGAAPGPTPGGDAGFDAVLVDLPCSNSGVLAKRVEARRRLDDAAARASLASLQARLVAAAATRVRPGGRFVVSTCSIDRDEGDGLVRTFLGASPAFTLDAERLTLPSAGRRDGGYVARLVRG